MFYGASLGSKLGREWVGGGGGGGIFLTLP